MYLAQNIWEVLTDGGTRYTLSVFRVVLGDDGRPMWTGRPTYRNNEQWSRAYLKSVARANVEFYGPLLPNLGLRKRVSKTEAIKLTGITLGAAALDFLTERLQNGHQDSPGLSNYRKPPKPKKAKAEPTAAARTEAARCAEKVAEYDRKVARAASRRDAWARRQARNERRATRLESVEAQPAKGE